MHSHQTTFANAGLSVKSNSDAAHWWMTVKSEAKLLIAIPALNEEDSIAGIIEDLRGMASRLEEVGVSTKVYVIDDGSDDATGAIAEASGADRVIRHRVNLGLGAAVRTALRVARDEGFDLLVKIDADRQHDAGDIISLIEPIIRGEADVVYGDRFERIEYRMPFVRRVGNLIFSSLMKRLTGWPVRDSQPGIFAINKDYLAVAFLPGDYNYTQQLLLNAYHNNMRFAQVPVAFRRRETGKSFISLKYPFKVLPQILLVVAFVKPMRIFVPLGLFFIAIGFGVFCIQFANWLLGNGNKPVENVNLVLGTLLFGVQTLFFGILAQLIVQTRR
jgi:glycosyltransferase involved in cell wall biosynthesis